MSDLEKKCAALTLALASADEQLVALKTRRTELREELLSVAEQLEALASRVRAAVQKAGVQ